MRVFIDASVFFAASYSSTGAARELFRLAPGAQSAGSARRQITECPHRDRTHGARRGSHKEDRQRLLQRLAVDECVMVGKPVIQGTRLTVEYILNLLTHGATVEEILLEYDGLTKDDIRACLLFAQLLEQHALTNTPLNTALVEGHCPSRFTL